MTDCAAPIRVGPERLLVVLPSWVGDIVMATPTLRALRRRFPAAHISLLIRDSLRDLLSGSPWMDELLSWAPHRGVLRTARLLRARSFDAALLLPNAFRAALTAFLARIPRRIGYARDARGPLLTDRLRVPRVAGRVRPTRLVDYYAALAEFVGCPPPGDGLELFTTTADEASVENRLAGLGIQSRKPLVLISPGASFGPSKLWLPERFAQLGDQLVDEFDAAVVMTCAPGEQALARQVAGLMHRPVCVFDEPVGTLAEFKALVRRSDLLINNDTGPRHIAKAFGVPVVTIFGSTDPRWTDTDYPLERQVRIEVDCGPCQQRVCPLGHHRCMTGVTVQMAFEACRGLLAPHAALASP